MTECIEWTKSVNEWGYGLAWDPADKRMKAAHKREWEHKKGPVPIGCHLHHTCRNKKCINVEHLEVLAYKEHAVEHAIDRFIEKNPGLILK